MQDIKISSLQKALKILSMFSLETPEWGVRELANRLSFSPATVQRLLQPLKEYGFLDQDKSSRKYRLGPVYFRFVEILQSQYPLVKEALPFMKVLCSQTGETTHLNVIDGQERLCISSVESPQNLKAGMPVGNRSPLYAGASSKCLLAFSSETFIEAYLSSIELKALTEKTITESDKIRKELKRIRDFGYAVSSGERTKGLCSISVPIFGYGGNLLGALSLAIPSVRFSDNHHKKFCLSRLLETGAHLSGKMGYGGPYMTIADDM